MIFNVPGHIEMIRNGLNVISPASVLYYPLPLRIVKTQTRRLKRGIYKIGRSYAVQRKRGVTAEPDIRIVMDRIWEERVQKFVKNVGHVVYLSVGEISKEDAWAEGGYTPEHYEQVFRELNPKWNGWSRWAFEFHVINSESIKRRRK